MKINLKDEVRFIESHMTLIKGTIIKIERKFVFNRYWIESCGNIYIVKKKRIIEILN